MNIQTLTRAEQIARLNDRARLGHDHTAKIVFTRNCLNAFSNGDTPSTVLAQAEIMKAMRQHVFDNDAHGERDFGKVNFRGKAVWFKIDYYDPELQYGSEDPADASVTCRVITIMLPTDY